MDCTLPGSSVHGIFQARILEWVDMPSFRDLPDPGSNPVSCVSLHWQADSLLLSHLGSPIRALSEVAQLCPTLCDPMDCTLPGSSVHGIFQAIVLEWIAISFPKGSSQPRDQTCVSRIINRRFTVWATRGRCKIVFQSDLPFCIPIGNDWKLLLLYILPSIW